MAAKTHLRRLAPATEKPTVPRTGRRPNADLRSREHLTPGHDTRALQAYLGHKNIQHTVRYTELSPTRFKDFWRK
jgi:type 1 fimbriae regulatory protein FimB/type 1 fimbriae regulatory protein FimE